MSDPGSEPKGFIDEIRCPYCGRDLDEIGYPEIFRWLYRHRGTLAFEKRGNVEYVELFIPLGYRQLDDGEYERVDDRSEHVIQAHDRVPEYVRKLVSEARRRLSKE